MSGEHEQFRHDMKVAGFNVREYRGRNFYDGPAVQVDESDDGWRPTFQEVIRATSVVLQRDNLGLDWIVYPKDPTS